MRKVRREPFEDFLGELCDSCRALRLKAFSALADCEALSRYSLPEQLFYVFNFVTEQVHLAGKPLDF